MPTSTANASELWHRAVEAHLAFSQASREFLAACPERTDILRQALRGRDRLTALTFLPSLKMDELKELFSDLVLLASSAHGSIQTVRSLVLSLPHDWVLQRIEQEAEPLLRAGTYDEYRRFLELYELLDQELMRKLACRAATHDDQDIREAGEDFLDRIQVPRPKTQAR